MNRLTATAAAALILFAAAAPAAAHQRSRTVQADLQFDGRERTAQFDPGNIEHSTDSRNRTARFDFTSRDLRRSRYARF